MLELFRGFEDGHGTYREEERRAGSPKSVIKKTAKTLREPVTVELWERHLQGERPLGIVPIRTNGECYWGVIDVDKYEDLSHEAIVHKLTKMDVPAVVCRSKSGGAHVFLFLREPVQAAELILKLRQIAAILGYGDCEIFPKQTEILKDRGDLGNWLNMPYFDAEKTVRYAVNDSGRGMTLAKFLDVAESRRLTAEQFDGLLTRSTADDEDLRDAPPCLQHLCRSGIAEGQKNNTLFNLGILAKKISPENWKELLEKWNRAYVNDPKLSSEEMMQLFKSVGRKNYHYRCKDNPLVQHCDRETCSRRKHGVGQAAQPDIGSITILDTTPPLFFVRMTSGGTVECEADDILSSRAFQRIALEQLRVLLPLYKQEAWQERIQACLEQAQVLEAPREASSVGALEEFIQQFCADRHAAQTKEEILLGKPWHDEETDKVFFRMRDLVAHLQREKFTDWTRQKLTQRVRDMGGGHHFFNLKNVGTNVWWLPWSRFVVQTEPFETPRGQESPI